MMLAGCPLVNRTAGNIRMKERNAQTMSNILAGNSCLEN
jgi:hypothetical protein